VLLPFAAVSGLAFRPGPTAIALLIALGTGPTAVAYTLYFRGLRGAPAGTAALLVAGGGSGRAARGCAARRDAYGATAPSKLAAYQSSSIGIFSTFSPVCGASMM
jgi:hypothetical protein